MTSDDLRAIRERDLLWRRHYADFVQGYGRLLPDLLARHEVDFAVLLREVGQQFPVAAVEPDVTLPGPVEVAW